MKFPKFNYKQEWDSKVEVLKEDRRNDALSKWNGQLLSQDYWALLASYKLSCFAERLRNKKIETWDHPPHDDLLRLYLINKHHWTLVQARQIQHEEDFLFVLREELEELKLREVESQPVEDSLSFRDDFEGFSQHFESAQT